MVSSSGVSVRNKTKTKKEPRLGISTLNGFEVVDLIEVLYCEANESYTTIHLRNGSKVCASKSLNTYEQLLQDYDFLRVHKSFVINLHHIKHYIKGQGGVVILSNGAAIEVSRRKKNVFTNAVKKFFII
jgi:two-component system, LytTR family, response regulator